MKRALASLLLLTTVVPFSRLLRALPKPLFRGAGCLLGELLHLLRFRTGIVSGNLRLALGGELSPEEISALQRRIYRNLGLSFLDIARNFALSAEEMRRELVLSDSDRQKIAEIMARGKGVVFLSAHLANWELLAMGMAAHGLPLAIVVKRMSSTISQTLIERQRSKTGLEIIYAGATIEKMRAALRRGLGIGFMMDQNVTGAKGIRCNFFGVPAASIRALGALVRDSGAAVLPICACRHPDGTLRVQLGDELPYLLAGDCVADLRPLREEWLNAQQYQTAVEEMVRRHPEQWLWIHRRWKARRDPLRPETAHLENDLASGAR